MSSPRSPQPAPDADCSDVFEALPYPAALVDPRGFVACANAAWRNAGHRAGNSPARVRRGESLLDAIASTATGATAGLLGDLRDVLAGNTPSTRRAISVQRGDQRFWYDARITACPTPKQRRALVCLVDVTESHHDRRRLAESEARFRLIAENSTDWITRHDRDGRYLWVSAACRDMLGYEPEELIQKNPYDYVHPEDAPYMEQAHGEILESAEVTSTEYRFRRKDGSYVWLESTARSIFDPEAGLITEMQCASRDITQRRATETMLRLIETAIDQVHDAVVITEPELELPGPRIAYVNRAFLRMTGYEEAEIIGQTPRALQGPKTDRSVIDRLVRDLNERGEFTGHTVNYRKDGTEYVVEWSITAVRDAHGRLINWVSIQRDITQRLRAQAERDRLQNELTHAGRLTSLGELASGLAHELNQPLAAIGNFARGIQRRVDSGWIDHGEISDAIEHIAAQAERAGDIIQHLRGFVRKREPQRDRVHLQEIVDDVQTLLSHEFEDNDIKLRCDDHAGNPRVYVDRVLVEQVLINVVRNAIEASCSSASPAAPHPLTLRTTRKDDVIEVAVIDRGTGLSPEQADRIFDPFYSTRGSGMGMGLTISQSIIESHGGKIVAEPNGDGPGAKVRFTIPLAD